MHNVSSYQLAAWTDLFCDYTFANDRSFVRPAVRLSFVRPLTDRRVDMAAQYVPLYYVWML